MRYVVILGNPITGFKFIGPFPNKEKAKKWLNGKLSISYEHDAIYRGATLGAVQDPKKQP